jgi:hypothetical protein
MGLILMEIVFLVLILTASFAKKTLNLAPNAVLAISRALVVAACAQLIAMTVTTQLHAPHAKQTQSAPIQTANVYAKTVTVKTQQQVTVIFVLKTTAISVKKTTLNVPNAKMDTIFPIIYAYLVTHLVILVLMTLLVYHVKITLSFIMISVDVIKVMDLI